MRKTIIVLLLIMINTCCMCINVPPNYNSNWSPCINRLSSLLESFTMGCNIHYHVVNDLIISIEKNPEKSWQLYDLMTRCNIHTTLKTEIMQHIELCLETNHKI